MDNIVGIGNESHCYRWPNPRITRNPGNIRVPDQGFAHGQQLCQCFHDGQFKE